MKKIGRIFLLAIITSSTALVYAGPMGTNTHKTQQEKYMNQKSDKLKDEKKVSKKKDRKTDVSNRTPASNVGVDNDLIEKHYMQYQ